MRTKTAKTALISVLMSLALVLIALGGLFLTKPQSANAAETSIIPIADAELMTSKATQVPGHDAVYWDSPATQMRLYFKFDGANKPGRQFAPTNGSDTDHVLVTNGGETKTITAWKNEGKIAWFGPTEGTANDASGKPMDADVYEMWINSTDTAWLTNISEVTIQKGFRWYFEGKPYEGAQVLRDYTLVNGGNDLGWMSKYVPGSAVTEKNSLGLAVKFEQPFTAGGSYGKNSTKWDDTTIRIEFTFENNKPGINSLFQVQDILGPYVELDGQKLEDIKGKFDWVTLGPPYGSDYSIAICANGAEGKEILQNLKEVKLLKGFKWVVCDQKGEFPHPTYKDQYKFLDGTELEEDVILWNGGEHGWLRRAASVEAWMPDGIEVLQNDVLDKSKIHAVATLLDGGKNAIDSDLLEVSVNTKDIGEQEVTVTYQDKTFKLPNKVKVTSTKKVTGIKLSKNEVIAHQYENPRLDDVTITATFDDQSEETIPASDVTVTVADRNKLWTIGEKTTATITYTLRGETVTTSANVTVGEPDLTTGMFVNFNGNNNTGGYMTISINFVDTEKFVADRNIYHTEKLNGSRLWDYIELTIGGNTKTITAWNSEDHLDLFTGVYNSGALMIYTDTHKTELGNVTKVTLKAGLEWVTANGDHWGETNADVINGDYFTVNNAVVKQDTTIWKAGDKWEKYATSISVKYTGASDIAVNGTLDLKKIELTATYGPDDTATIPVTAGMLEYDFGSEGEKTVTVTYQDHTATFTVNVSSSEQLTGIELTTEPSNKNYVYGELNVDLSGAVIEAVYTKTGGETRKESVELTDPNIKISGYDPYHLGEQTVTIEYYNFTASFKITMAVSEEWGIEFNWQTGTSYEPLLKNEGLHIPASVKGYGPSPVGDRPALKAVLIYGRDTAYNDTLWSKIEINGRPATEWIQEGVLEWAGFYGNEFVFTVSSSQHKLVWGTDSALYQEGVSEIIGTVKLLPGFQWYTSSDGGDHWPPAGEQNYLRPVNKAVLAEELYIMNNNGEGWVLPLKENADGTVASDAITLISLPEKTEYTVGDSFLVKGFKVRLTKTDGSTEDYEPRTNQITGDGLTMKLNGTSVFTKAGTITLTFTYYEGATYSFQVTVKESEGDTPTPPPAEHEHTFSDQWTYDENNHWHAATCDDTTEKKDTAAHTFGEDGKCTVCGYERGTTPPPTEEPSKGCGTIALGGSGWGGGIALGILAVGAALVMFLRKKRA